MERDFNYRAKGGDDTDLDGEIEINAAISNPWNSSYQYDFNGNIESLTRLDQAGNPWDNISYSYPMDQQTSQKKVSNRLQEVNNPITGPDNYPLQNEFEYDDLGNLSAESDGTLSMEWTNSGKLKKVTKPGVYELTFTYDAMGNRVTKNRHNIPTGNNNLTYYLRDAQGNNMATYVSIDLNNPSTQDYILKELYLYGSNRLGYLDLRTQIQNPTNPFSELPPPGSQFFAVSGSKRYELSNHLGNVLAVVSDVAPNNNQATLMACNDYFPFGSPIQQRCSNASSNQVGNDYRFGFNTQERTDEIAGFGNHNTALFWEYDTRLGRRWNLDPKYKARQSAFSAFSNNPLIFIDPNGDWDYYSKAGNWLGKVGEEEGMRIISIFDWKELDQKCATPQEYEDVSAPLRVEDDCLEDYLNYTYEQTNMNCEEFAFHIVIDYSIEGSPILRLEPNLSKGATSLTKTITCSPDKIEGEPVKRPADNKLVNKDLILVGELHGHGTTDDKGRILEIGVSEETNEEGGNDLTTARKISAPNYAVDKSFIHKADQNGRVNNNLEKSTNILIDAIETKGGKK